MDWLHGMWRSSGLRPVMVYGRPPACRRFPSLSASKLAAYIRITGRETHATPDAYGIFSLVPTSRLFSLFNTSLLAARMSGQRLALP